MAITNKRISRYAETIFANNDNDVRRALPMAGRQQALDQFIRASVERGGPQIVTVSAPLGAGKTFFLNNAFSHLVNTTEFPEALNRVVTFGSRGPQSYDPNSVDRLVERFAAAKSSHRLVLVVEE